MSTLPEEPAYPVLDSQRLIQITDSDQALIDLLLANFCEDIQRQYQALQDCCKNGSVEQQYIILHKMKGAVGNIGGKRLERRLANGCDRTGKDGKAIGEEEVQNLERELNQLLECIEKTVWPQN